MSARPTPHIRIILSLIFAFGLLQSTTGWAQPGGQPYPQPYPQPGPQPAPYYGSYAPGPNLHLLTPEERELLWQGEISPLQTIGGGLMAAWIGFGVGHAVQGRYSTDGWLFTVGEVASLAAMFVGLARVSNGEFRRDNGAETLLIGGAIGFGVFRIWEIVDAFVGPSAHNRRYQDLRWRTYGSQAPRYGLFVAPGGGQGGGSAGFSLRF